jgi:hypothetical protein
MALQQPPILRQAQAPMDPKRQEQFPKRHAFYKKPQTKAKEKLK